METTKLIAYAKQLGAVSLVKIAGPNGAFISLLMKDGSKQTMPVGKKSQEGKLVDYNVLITDDNVAIATVNNYVEQESIAL